MSAPPKEHQYAQEAVDECDHELRRIGDERARVMVLRSQLRAHLQALIFGWPTVARRAVAEAVSAQPATCEDLSTAVAKAVDTGEFNAGVVIERDVVGGLILAWFKHSAGPVADGCRVMVPAPVVVLTRPKARGEAPS